MYALGMLPKMFLIVPILSRRLPDEHTVYVYNFLMIIEIENK